MSPSGSTPRLPSGRYNVHDEQELRDAVDGCLEALLASGVEIVVGADVRQAESGIADSHRCRVGHRPVENDQRAERRKDG